MEKTGVPSWRKKHLDAEKYLENWMKFLLFKSELMWTKKKGGTKCSCRLREPPAITLLEAE